MSLRLRRARITGQRSGLTSTRSAEQFATMPGHVPASAAPRRRPRPHRSSAAGHTQAAFTHDFSAGMPPAGLLGMPRPRPAAPEHRTASLLATGTAGPGQSPGKQVVTAGARLAMFRERGALLDRPLAAPPVSGARPSSPGRSTQVARAALRRNRSCPWRVERAGPQLSAPATSRRGHHRSRGRIPRRRSRWRWRARSDALCGVPSGSWRPGSAAPQVPRLSLHAGPRRVPHAAPPEGDGAERRGARALRRESRKPQSTPPRVERICSGMRSSGRSRAREWSRTPGDAFRNLHQGARSM